MKKILFLIGLFAIQPVVNCWPSLPAFLKPTNKGEMWRLYRNGACVGAIGSFAIGMVLRRLAQGIYASKPHDGAALKGKIQESKKKQEAILKKDKNKREGHDIVGMMNATQEELSLKDQREKNSSYVRAGNLVYDVSVFFARTGWLFAAIAGYCWYQSNQADAAYLQKMIKVVYDERKK